MVGNVMEAFFMTLSWRLRLLILAAVLVDYVDISQNSTNFDDSISFL